MKTITRENFKVVFPQLVKDLQDASYIAVDLEFTGIDCSPVNDVNFMNSTEAAFREKISAASRFSPMQIGFSIFRGDTALDGNTGRPSAAFSAMMEDHLRRFLPTHAPGKRLRPLLEAMAARGVVCDADVQKLHAARAEALRVADGAVAASSSSSSSGGAAGEPGNIHDQLRAFSALDEVDAAVAMAAQWKRDAEAARRHLFVQSYACYLFPAASEGDGKTVLLSCEAMQFLRRNAMDLNRWLDESLWFVPLEEYLAAKRATLRPADPRQAASQLDKAVDALLNWISAFPPGDAKSSLMFAFGEIDRFARTAQLGDTKEAVVPFLPQPRFTQMDNLLNAMGIRVVRKVMRKVPLPTANVELLVDENPRFFGTRVLNALVNATREQKKTLVVHNGALDLSFLVCAMHKPPKTLVAFKRCVRELFPIFYDTRTLTCAPSMQDIANLTGPLKKTYSVAKNLARSVQIYSGSGLNAFGDDGLREHDAASDAFMSGALFAYAQDLLTQRGADFSRLRCITPLHGCMFSLLFNNDNNDGLVQVPNAPMFLIKRPPGQRINPDGIRERLQEFIKHVSILFHGELCLLTVGEKSSQFGQRDIMNSLNAWCGALDCSVRQLNVDSRCKELGIIYVSEMADN